MKLLVLYAAYCATILACAVALHQGCCDTPWAKKVLRDAQALKQVGWYVWERR